MILPARYHHGMIRPTRRRIRATRLGAVLIALLARASLLLAAEPAFPEFRRPPEGRDKLPVLPAVAVDEAGKPITTREGWAAARGRLLERWKQIIGPFPERVPLAPE